MRQATRDAADHKPATKRHDPARRRKASDTGSMELTEKKSGKGPAKQDSFKELREDKLLGVDQRDKGYKELLKQEALPELQRRAGGVFRGLGW